MKWFLALLLCLILTSTHAQFKFEQESRVSVEDVPQPALNFVDQLVFDKKIKWFIERSDSGISYEMKSRRGKDKFSIEFNEQGLLQDVEKEVELDALPVHIQQIIVSELKAKFLKYKIKKIQIQAKGSNDSLKQYVMEGLAPTQTRIAYEIVVRASSREDGLLKRYEILIHAGKGVLSLKEIISRPTDNLEF